MKSMSYALLLLYSLATAEPQFERLFTRPGVVGEGWLVGEWTDVSKPPKWPVV